MYWNNKFIKVINNCNLKIAFLLICGLLVAAASSYANVDTEQIYKRIWKLEKVKSAPVSEEDEIFVKFDLSGKAYIISGDSWNSKNWNIDKLNVLSVELLGEEKWKIQLLNSSLLILMPNKSYDPAYTFIEMTDQDDKDRLAGIFKEIRLNVTGLASLLKNKNHPIAQKIYDQPKAPTTFKTASEVEEEQEYLTNADSPMAAANAENMELLVDTDHRSAPGRIKKEPVSAYIKVKSATAPSIYTASKNKYSGRSISADRVAIPRKHIDPFAVSDNDYIEIFVSGGGFKGGINPKIHDRILIHDNGLVQREFVSVHGGEENFTKRVKKSELVELAQIIVDSDYFNYKESYDCEADDQYCQNAVNGKPEPIPLKLVIAVGMVRHVVDVPVFAPGVSNAIDYPKSLETVVEAIYNLARN